MTGHQLTIVGGMESMGEGSEKVCMLIKVLRYIF